MEARSKRGPLGALALTLGALGLGACQGTPQAAEGRENPRAALRSGTRGVRIELPSGPEFLEIQSLETTRDLDGGRLLELLEHPDDRVRVQAARALGRFPFPDFGSEVTRALCSALEDAVPEVRYAAAFALGLRGDPDSAGVLSAYRNDRDPQLRARVIEAASRVGRPSIHLDLLGGLLDSDLVVRMETAVATARWDPTGPDADAVDRALVDALRPYEPGEGNRLREPRQVEPELAWKILFALSRRSAELGKGAFLEYASSDHPLEQLFAVRGLARIAPDETTRKALGRVLETRPTDWRVAYEAVLGLGRGGGKAPKVLLDFVEHDNAHVRAGALAALGSFKESQSEVLARLRRGLLDVSANARVAALEAMVRLVPASERIELLESFAAKGDPIERAGAARSARHAAGPAALELLRGLIADAHPRVAGAAVESLAFLDPQTARPLLHELLGTEDNGLRLAAVLALREEPSSEDLEPLEQVFEASQGDISTEIAFNVVRNLGEIGGERARDFVRRRLGDGRAHVRRVAREVLEASFGLAPSELGSPRGEPFDPGGEVPLAGRDYPRWTHNPMVEVRTSRGSMVFELFPADAPVHVHNFLTLAEAEAYDGLDFHRVVPDFVIQGGDYRGDGNGASPWQGTALRQEFNARKYGRGALGMPRNEDVDSGGSQFFVTHRPTPHLDGLYTLFGQLRVGGDVLDAIEVGDRILDVRLLR